MKVFKSVPSYILLLFLRPVKTKAQVLKEGFNYEVHMKLGQF